jgi:hypothetical protein
MRFVDDLSVAEVADLLGQGGWGHRKIAHRSRDSSAAIPANTSRPAEVYRGRAT